MKDAGRAGAGQVQSLVRALDLLRALAAAPDGLILRDVARAAGLPVSTTHRLLTTLEGERFARVNPETGAWTIGAEAFAVGMGFARARDLSALARPRLRALVQRWSETASLYVEAEGGLVCVAQAESRQMVRAVARVGGVVALHCTAAGKALMGVLPAAERAALLAGLALSRRTPRTLTDRAALAAEVAAAAASGRAVDDEELVEGVRCVAAAVRDHDGAPIAAISVSGPAQRLTAALTAEIGASVAAAAAELSHELGWRAPA